MTRIVSTELEPGAPRVMVEISRQDDREEDVSALSDVLSFDDLAESVARISRSMTDALRRARPDEAEVTFGVDVAVEAGRLTSLLVKGGATATFGVRLLWKASPRDGATPDVDPPPPEGDPPPPEGGGS
ncbi:CU044_2847 family protein [Cellulomonas palmilytica]|uniref:CU044_2847 family protein n=1 Tax=Cellulomonas palmilytica TaxID=2608402 RepID=UPI001F36C545|nr:CU044_2847 family protein [Cellulomonas palmilytica]UJP41285.1 hypothetical protein F1D97_07595 [Cellulomonas palmilytica]